MKSVASEVVECYEKWLGRNPSETEKADVRTQCAADDLRLPKTRDLEKFGIRLNGLEYDREN